MQRNVHTEFKGKSNMITWSTSRSRPLAARSVQTNVGQSPSSLLNFFKFSTLPQYPNLSDLIVFLLTVMRIKMKKPRHPPPPPQKKRVRNHFVLVYFWDVKLRGT